MLNIVLVEPEIPGNTGNIARTCAITGAMLHLVEPLGFSIEEKQIRRAGLDYWDKLKLQTYTNLDTFFAENTGGAFYYFSTKARQTYTQVAYPEEAYMLFGKETAGLPEQLIFDNPDTAVRIPMREDLRSLNLGNAAAIAIYEYCRQHDFAGLW